MRGRDIGGLGPDSYGPVRHLSFTRFGYDIGRMDSGYDPEREAKAAMKLAAATAGLERQRLIRLAMAWQELARMRAPSRTGAEEAAYPRSGPHSGQVSPIESSTSRISAAAASAETPAGGF